MNELESETAGREKRTGPATRKRSPVLLAVLGVLVLAALYGGWIWWSSTVDLAPGAAAPLVNTGAPAPALDPRNPPLDTEPAPVPRTTTPP
ncbi:hypothetical protein WG922_17705 [Ramlibacter sp. AN1015]|uniref:hypothetical protein n=1 Tax=Ramlibacter sp. AN1015 TaxID=3133428 RepID=UPI0030C1DB31